MNNSWNELADDSRIQNTITALEKNGMKAVVVDNGLQAKQKVLDLIPKGAEVMDMLSKTLKETGIAQEITNSNNYKSVRNELNKMDRKTQSLEMQKLGSAPEWAIGSVHAVTEDGKVIVASRSGSQLPAYVYGSEHVIWVVGAQKIVKDFDAGLKRIYEYVLPLESKRVQEAYGMKESEVAKLILINKEVKADRITVIIAKEKLGF